MGSLILAILASSSIALLFKLTESRGMNRYAVTCGNYVAAASASLVAFLGSRAAWEKTQPGRVWTELGPALAGTAEMSAGGSLGWALALGMPVGVIYFLGFMIYQRSVRDCGASVSGAFAKMGLAIPILASCFLWNEWPGPVQWVAIGLLFIAIVLVNYPQEGKGFWESVRWPALALFVVGGLAEGSTKLYQQYGRPEHKEAFLLALFGVALLVSAVPLVAGRRKPTPSELGVGLLVGIPNVATSYFLILALQSVPGSVAFAVFAAGCILVITLASWLLAGERLTRLEAWGVAIVALALVLLNLGR
jgi:drug/metabolite transporter (DMT)-like permease